MKNIAYVVPDEATLLDVAEQAAEQGLALITDGRKVVISPWIPPGWHRMGVCQKPATTHERMPKCGPAH